MHSYYITGINGFLGRNLVSTILSHEPDAEIIGLFLPSEIDGSFPYKVIIKQGNILNKYEVNNFINTPCKGDKILIHAAGRISVYKKGDPLTTTVNVEGTKTVADIAKENNVKTFIYVSSVDALDKRNDEGIIYEQDYYHIDKVDGVYSKSKVLASNYVLDQASDDFKVIIVNPSAIMGPNDPFDAPINNAIKKAINNKLPAIVKGGYNIVDVRDVAEGIYQLIDKGMNKQSYLLVGEYISVKDLMHLSSQIAGSKKVKFIVPHWIIKLISPFIEIYSKMRKKKPLFTGFSMDCLKQNSHYSYAKCQTLFSYQPRNIENSLIDTINYLRK